MLINLTAIISLVPRPFLCGRGERGGKEGLGTKVGCHHFSATLAADTFQLLYIYTISLQSIMPAF